mgnify:CR=1 FL=1|tara:strand:+ start:390 stop:617 length:228 start_codon:yes stop_codon:yes gene_type:complete
MTNNENQTDYSKLARWLCLYEAVNIISDKADKIGAGKDCLKPIPISKYITERYPSLLKDLEHEIQISNSHHTRRR